jgi:hypothetical protein
MAVLYEDRRLVLDDDAMTIHDYYFPRGSRRIPYREIRGFEEYTMSLLTGKLTLWGTLDLVHWFHLDASRPQKHKAISVNLGAWVRPVVTPDDTEAVLRILRQKTGSHKKVAI